MVRIMWEHGARFQTRFCTRGVAEYLDRLPRFFLHHSRHSSLILWFSKMATKVNITIFFFGVRCWDSSSGYAVGIQAQQLCCSIACLSGAHLRSVAIMYNISERYRPTSMNSITALMTLHNTIHHAATLKAIGHELCHSLMASHNTLTHAATLKALE
jgi:hypothetical protein